MAWDHLDIDKPHLAYMILGGFTSLFMLCSLFVKERLYIGEATVATLCGVIFGPHAANLFDPISWGNVDKITLECSRIVLVVQCFAVGVELPKSYMERHWRSVTLLLLPVMTWGWLVTSLFIWWMIEPLSWLESLAIAACVTATDPVLASSVVGKGKFAKRVPKHLRDLLSAESGCNDGMAFPFIYLAVYIMHYRPDTNAVALHWFCFTILYECVVGAIFGFTIGYIGRHAIKFAERRSLIDRESFLVFYFVLALFCAGAGSLLGMDDLLIGFAAGVGFSNDGWFTEKTEESHVSNVIDLLLNLTYFVYFGAIIPWQQFNAPELGIVPWRLVVIAIMVIFFRRLPIMLLLKPFIPDVKSWREAMFAGHFGPIGVGAIFACILTRAEVETGTTQPLEVLPKPGDHNYLLVSVIWPVTTFIVISSILVHGSSIAVFTLGKHINTLTISMSYTQANEEGPSWMNRLPRIQSISKGSLSLRRDSMESDKEKSEFPPGTLGPIGVPGTFLRRQKDDDDNDGANSRSSSMKPSRRRKIGAGGPVSDSAIAPQRRHDISAVDGGADSPFQLKVSPPEEETPADVGEREPELEAFQEGDKMIIEDEEGNVLKTLDIRGLSPEQQKEQLLEQHKRIREDRAGELAKSQSQPHEKTEGEVAEEVAGRVAAHPYQNIRQRLTRGKGAPKAKGKDVSAHEAEEIPKRERDRRSARAYQYANTVIVEDEDGEVIRKYTIPAEKRQETGQGEHNTFGGQLAKLGNMMGIGNRGESSETAKKHAAEQEEEDALDQGIRFTVPVMGREAKRHGLGGRRMSKKDFIDQIQHLGPQARHEAHVDDIPGQLMNMFRRENRQQAQGKPATSAAGAAGGSSPQGEEPTSTDEIPTHDVAATLARYSGQDPSAAEERRRRHSATQDTTSPSTFYVEDRRRDSEDDGTERIPPALLRQLTGQSAPTPSSSSAAARGKKTMEFDNGETPAERKRRLAALGELRDPSRGSQPGSRRESDSEDDGGFRTVKGKIQFADGTRPAKSKSSATLTPFPTVPLPDAAGSTDEDKGEDGHSGPSSADESGSGGGNGDGEGSGGPRSSASRISWGGERGRDA